MKAFAGSVLPLYVFFIYLFFHFVTSNEDVLVWLLKVFLCEQKRFVIFEHVGHVICENLAKSGWGVRLRVSDSSRD